MKGIPPAGRFGARRFALSLIALLSFSTVAIPHRLPAQPTPSVPVEARTTADAARCLAIDNEVAALNTRLRRGEITAAERKARADALTAERTRLTNAYGAHNTAAYRGLVVEFNRLRAAATVEAREQAAAETKAKRDATAAAAQQKRDQAAADAQAKRDAIAAAEAEKARLAALADAAVTADVSAVAEERLERARDRFHQGFRLPAPNSPAVAATQTAAAESLRARHVPPAVPELRPPFDQRVDMLVKQLLPERTQAWFVAVFPSPESVLGRGADDTEKSAALELVSRRLAEHTPGVRLAAAQAKIEAYQAARGALKPDFVKVTRLTLDRRFEAKVFAPSLPAYAQSLEQRVAHDEALAAAEARRRRLNQMMNLVALVMIAIGLWLPIRLMRHQRFRWKRQSESDWNAQMAQSPLPKELWWIEVPGFRYPVSVISGKVYDKEVWTETNVTTTTTTSHGPNYGYGYNSGQTTTQTHVSTTVYHRYWMITTEGKQTWHRYSDNEMLATVGQKLSSIWSDNYWVVLAYNHDTRTVVFPAWWTKTMHKPPFWRIVGLTTLAGLVVALAGSALLSLTMGINRTALNGPDGMVLTAGAAVLVPLFVGLMIYVGIAGAIFTALRQRHFRKRVAPRYEAFLRQYDPVIPAVEVAVKDVK